MLWKSPAAETLPHTSDINSANKHVEIELEAQGLWKNNHSYSDEMKTKIGRYGAEMAILML